MSFSTTIVLFLAVYIGIPVLVCRHLLAKKKAKEEADRKLLLQNPDAWERAKRLEMEVNEKNKDRAAGAANVGLGLALRLLRK